MRRGERREGGDGGSKRAFLFFFFLLWVECLPSFLPSLTAHMCNPHEMATPARMLSLTAQLEQKADLEDERGDFLLNSNLPSQLPFSGPIQIVFHLYTL